MTGRSVIGLLAGVPLMFTLAAWTPAENHAQAGDWKRDPCPLLTNFDNMYNPCVVETKRSYRYRMWFFGWSVAHVNPGIPGADAIFHARSKDLKKWEVYSKGGTWDATMTPAKWEPVLYASDRWFEAWHVGDPSVVLKDGRYHMVYSSTSKHFPEKVPGYQVDMVQCLMAAVSEDGIHWNKTKKPILIRKGDAPDPKPEPERIGDFHRPCLRFENGKWRLWFDYWLPGKGVCMGYAENPGEFMAPEGFTIRNDLHKPLLANWPNPEVIKVGDRYHSFSDPIGWPVPDGTPPEVAVWESRQLREAISDDGMSWKKLDFIPPDKDADACHVPQALVTKIDGKEWLYLFYATQVGHKKKDGHYHYQYDRIRAMRRPLSSERSATPSKAIRVNRARIRPISEPVAAVDFRKTQWIWSQEETDPLEKAQPGFRFFRRTFELENPGKVSRAFLLAAADNGAHIYVNGTYCGTATDFLNWYEMDFGDCLRPGRNVISVEASNAGTDPNPAGFAAMAILLAEASNPLLVLPTNAKWTSCLQGADDWKEPDCAETAWRPAVPLGEVGCLPWGSIGFLKWDVPRDFPVFYVPGEDKRMELLRQLFWLHYQRSGPAATLWDPWMPMSSLWPAARDTGQVPSFREAWKETLLNRRVDDEGYVSTHQHHGFAHGEGWPFPMHTQTHGVGWQFGTDNIAYAVEQTRDVSHWELTGIESGGIDTLDGWTLQIHADHASLTTPAFNIDCYVAPFVRLEWWKNEFPEGATATLEWATGNEPAFDATRSMKLRLQPDAAGGMFTHIPLYRHKNWGGRLTRFRLSFRNARGATVHLRGLISAADSRHSINGAWFLEGCTEYFNWTGDLDFLRRNITRMRKALAFSIREFGVDRTGWVTVPWVGHDGRPGFTRHEDGTKTIRYGRGIGNNYYDLLPFGGEDCSATIYTYDALRRMAELEREIAGCPEWQLPAPQDAFTGERLQVLADMVKKRAGDRFWEAKTGRFVGAIDTAGVRYDYGFTFVNCDAVYYGFADGHRAKSIVDWLDGRRIVKGDTSVGGDIYHFRFAPRITTRRNIEWYMFAWNCPEGIPWGGQIQDGGAVLGFAFQDQMARLMTAGPDNAWKALERTIDWFADIKKAGGYRAYYAVPGRGTLQGGGPPGGLGMDREFVESVLVPQIMLYGFLGFRAEPGGFRLAPQLPSSWPSLRVLPVHFRDSVLEIAATKEDAAISHRGGEELQCRLTLPTGWTAEGQDVRSVELDDEINVAVDLSLRNGETLRLIRKDSDL